MRGWGARGFGNSASRVQAHARPADRIEADQAERVGT